MGSTTHWHTKHLTAAQFADQHIRWSTNYTVVDRSVSGNTVYWAIRQPDGRVFAAVMRLSRNQGDWNERTVTEMEGPLDYGCPIRILDRLSEPQNGYAREWREACRNNAKKLRPNVGDTVIFDKPITFNDGTSESVFTVRRDHYPVSKRKSKTVFIRKCDNVVCHIRGFTNLRYRVVRKGKKEKISPNE